MGEDYGGSGRRRTTVGVVVAVVLLLGAGLLVAGWGGDDDIPRATVAFDDDRDGLTGDTDATTTTTDATTTTSSTTTTTTAGPAGPPPPAGPAALSPKKGVSVWDFGGLGPALGDVGAAWYYNWSSGPSAGDGDGTEFVPMIWGRNSVTSSELNRATTAGTSLLGFNEPDFSSQSNLPVEEALELWPRLEATGLRLGSPAVAVGAADPGGWLDLFMIGARERGLRVDFIALHWYGSDFSDAAVGHLRSYVEAVHARYGLPVWITEYTLIRWDDSGAVFPTDAEQAAFVTGSTRMLQSLPFVERYAWFALPTPKEGGQGTGLYHYDAVTPTPTPAGAAYRAAGGDPAPPPPPPGEADAAPTAD